MLNAVLTKPPLLPKKVIESFLDDIANNKDILMSSDGQFDKKTLYPFLKVRYFNHIGTTLRKCLFRSLWKFVFMADNPQCNSNRAINFMALCCLYQTYNEELLNFIKLEPKYFGVMNDFLDLLYNFLIICPDVFSNLQEDNKILIKNLYEHNDIHARILGVFISNNFEQHCDMLSDFAFEEHRIPKSIEKDISLLYDYSDRIYKSHCVLQSYIKIFRRSGSFDEASKNFYRWIRPYLNFMKETELSELLNSIKANYQIYGCWAIKREFEYINSFMQFFWGDSFNLRDELEHDDDSEI